MSNTSNYGKMQKRGHCYFCGAFGGIEEHHVIPQRFGGPDKKDNIVGLCGRCHNKLEKLYDKSFYEWFGIDDKKGQRKYHRACQSDGCTNPVAYHLRNEKYSTDFYFCNECAAPYQLEALKVVETWGTGESTDTTHNE